MEPPKEDGFTCEEISTQLQTLTTLDLREKEITDLRPLSGLHTLKYLYLSHNKISNLWALEDLPALVLLDLKSNTISDIGALPDFTNLEAIFLDDNRINNILPIKDLFKLKKVSLENNPILTNEPDKTEDLKGLIESLIFFRSRCTLEHYAPLDLNDIIEASTFLNDMADRGDLSYFRALEKSADKFHVFYNQELWSLLKPSTKRIIIAISQSKKLTNFLIDKFQTTTKSILPIDDYSTDKYSKIMDAIEYEKGRVERAIQYFIMDPEGTYPFSMEDSTPLQRLFIDYSQQIKNQKREFLLPAIKVYFSPRFVGRALEEWRRNARPCLLSSISACRLTHHHD